MKRASGLEKLGLQSRLDFVLHLPLRYEDETALSSPESAPPGKPVQVEAALQKVEVAYRPLGENY